MSFRGVLIASGDYTWKHVQLNVPATESACVCVCFDLCVFLPSLVCALGLCVSMHMDVFPFCSCLLFLAKRSQMRKTDTFKEVEKKKILDWACKNNKQGNTPFVSVAADMRFHCYSFYSYVMSSELMLHLMYTGRLEHFEDESMYLKKASVAIVNSLLLHIQTGFHDVVINLTKDRVIDITVLPEARFLGECLPICIHILSVFYHEM